MKPSTDPVQFLIETLKLRPLPVEGGMFAQTYIAADLIPASALPGRYGGRARPCSTAIYYLLTADPDSFSALHRLTTDEVYHFYLGDPLEITMLLPGGSSQVIALGQDLANGQAPQVVVPAGAWQGSRVKPGGTYALVGTTMAPGYSDEDFELGEREELLEQYPCERERIIALTRVKPVSG